MVMVADWPGSSVGSPVSGAEPSALTVAPIQTRPSRLVPQGDGVLSGGARFGEALVGATGTGLHHCGCA